MRERLTFSFVIVTMALLTGAFLVRSYSLEGSLDGHESTQLHREAQAFAISVDQRQQLGQAVDTEFVASLAGADTRVVYAPRAGGGGAQVAAQGDGFTGTGRDEDDLAASAETTDGTITVSQSGGGLKNLVLRDLRPTLLLLLLAAVLAAAIGYVVARALSSPFRQLAEAAGALGRGRFDLDLPRSRIPEARAISQALGSSAERLQERIVREQEFSQHASHVLRTPLTGLRLELEDLTLRDDLPADAREQAARCLQRVEGMDVVAGELVELSRRGSLVEGAEVTLRDLATQSAQRWADELGNRDRPVSAGVEGDLETTYTPGPVEQVLELLLVDVVRRGRGAVRMAFAADPQANLSIRISTAALAQPDRGHAVDEPVSTARNAIIALGGRLEGESPDTGFTVLLPRR